MKTRLLVLGFLAGLIPTTMEAQRVYSFPDKALARQMQEFGEQLLENLPLSPMLLFGVLVLVTGIWLSYFREAWVQRKEEIARHPILGAGHRRAEFDSLRFSAPSGGHRVVQFQGREERTRFKAAKNEPPLDGLTRRRQPEPAG